MAKKEQDWTDISNEEYRKYLVMTAKGIAEVRIANPKGLKIEKVDGTGGRDSVPEIEHVVLDSNGEQHRITSGWLKLSFKMKEA